MGKKIASLLFYFLVLSACSVSNLPTPKSNVGMVDYSTLTQQGYFVTESNSGNFDYKAIGSIYAEEVGGWVSKDGISEPIDPKEKYYITSNHKQVYQAPSLQKAYSNIANKLNSVGANGIINLKISFTTATTIGNHYYPEKIVITDMAIKR